MAWRYMHQGGAAERLREAKPVLIYIDSVNLGAGAQEDVATVKATENLDAYRLVRGEQGPGQ